MLYSYNLASYWIRSLTIFDFHCTFILLYDYSTIMMCSSICESAEGCSVAMSLVTIDLPSILVSSLALYSVLLMASSTPYPESRVFVSEGVYKKPLCCKQYHPTIYKLHKWILLIYLVIFKSHGSNLHFIGHIIKKK